MKTLLLVFHDFIFSSFFQDLITLKEFYHKRKLFVNLGDSIIWLNSFSTEKQIKQPFKFENGLQPGICHGSGPFALNTWMP